MAEGFLNMFLEKNDKPVEVKGSFSRFERFWRTTYARGYRDHARRRHRKTTALRKL